MPAIRGREQPWPQPQEPQLGIHERQAVLAEVGVAIDLSQVGLGDGPSLSTVLGVHDADREGTSRSALIIGFERPALARVGEAHGDDALVRTPGNPTLAK